MSTNIESMDAMINLSIDFYLQSRARPHRRTKLTKDIDNARHLRFDKNEYWIEPFKLDTTGINDTFETNLWIDQYPSQ